jgi:hypothetical protein
MHLSKNHSGRICRSPSRSTYERNQHRLRCSYRAICDPSALQDERTETADRRDQITKDVPILRFNHVPTEGFVHGVWQGVPVAIKPDLIMKESNGKVQRTDHARSPMRFV